MSHSATLPELRRALEDALRPRRLRAERGHDGALILRILSEAFEEAADPEQVVERALAERGLTLPDRTVTFLKAPSELEEGEEEILFSPKARDLPTWGDTLLLEPDEHCKRHDDDRHFDFPCKVIAFWGLKGGVGRTTALAHVAKTLGHWCDVLAVDLDLDSPGLVPVLAREGPANGALRLEQLIYLAADDGVSEEDLVGHARHALRHGKGSRRVYVVGPAHADSDFVKDLLGPLAPSALYRGGKSAIRRLLSAAIRATQAEYVLLDARSGYCDESAIALLDLADEVVLFVSPSPGTFGSLAPAIEALERNRRALGRPRMVHLVAGMLPAGEAARSAVLDQLRIAAMDERRRVAELLATPQDDLPPEIWPITIDYSARIVENEGLLSEDVPSYNEIVGRIAPSAGVPLHVKIEEWPATAAKELIAFFREKGLPEGSTFTENDWPDKDIFQLVVDTLLKGSPMLTEQAKRLGVVDADGIGKMPLRRWGDMVRYLWEYRLGDEEGRVRTMQWMRERLQDGHARLTPGIVVLLLKRAFEIRGEESVPPGSLNGLPLLESRHLRAALPRAAEDWLARIREKSSEDEARAIEKLKGRDADQLRGALTAELGLDSFDTLQKLGFFRLYQRYDGTEIVRVVDLYAFAPSLQIKRSGRR